MSNLSETIRGYIQTELRGVYTVLPAIVEQVDESTRRCEVSLKDDENVLIDNIPIASTYAGDGYGEIVPLKPGDEGLLLCLKNPLDRLLSNRGHIAQRKHRQHSFEDSVFFPRIWFDDDAVPQHDPGEYLLQHESGSGIRIRENGDIVLEHKSGTTRTLTASGFR